MEFLRENLYKIILVVFLSIFKSSNSFVRVNDIKLTKVISIVEFISQERETVQKSNHVYVGCFDAWERNTLSYTTTVFTESNSLEECIQFCNAGVYSFVLLKGKYCGCMTWDKFQNARVEESFCDVKCPGNEGANCGGNHEFSVYCNNEGGNCTEFKPSLIKQYFLKSQDLKSELETNLNLKVSSFERIDPVYSCINCTNNIYSCVQSGISPSYDYVPQNTPLVCAEYCAQPVTYFNNGVETVRQPTKYALAGWDTRMGQFGAIEISICKCSDNILDNFSEIEVDYCTKRCPNVDDLCGGPERGIFTVYCSDPNGCTEY